MLENTGIERALLEIIKISQITNSLAEVARAAGLDPAIDFLRADLSGIDFEGIDFLGVDTRHANFEDASLIGALNQPIFGNALASQATGEIPKLTLKKMLEDGVHFGRRRNKRHPSMREYIFTVRNGIDIFNLDVTKRVFADSLAYISSVSQSNGKILFVSRKDKVQKHVREAAIQCGQHYVTDRWLGGFLTNWRTVSHQVDRYRIESQRRVVGLTKKELGLRDRALDKAARKYEGVVGLSGMPDILISLDAETDKNAIIEARSRGVTVIAIADSDTNYKQNAEFLIPGNTASLKVNRMYLEAFAAASLHGQLRAV